ncbi:helix-turn-helix domain-containing protein [Enterococcus gallinarum]|uniref:helix-turn-helix domain-containing protein n=1 Tax=Enterococcus gallinarum TaxID=1353 RepID=UPI00115D946F|nr:helix-turn-helix domain-containing protein [Enterococcus gallinarum]MCD5076593.1 helix-turn-helix domain-containing protein [Enterococcus gallinarum]
MIRFLEKNYRKMEEIIRVLSISDKWMTKKELARHIGSSESTFIRYIEEIKQRWGNVLTIKTSHKLGYRLENFNATLYLQTLTDMARTSTTTQLLHEFIQQPGKTIDYYCEAINISRSSFARKLKHCNKVLAAYSLRVIVDRGYQLTSQDDELSLRIFTTYFFLMYYGHCDLPYHFDKQELKQVMRRNHCILNSISLDNSYEHDFFIMYFIVDLLRESQGFRQRPITKIAVKAKISNEDYSLIKRHLSGISLESCQTVIDYFQKGAFQQFYSENRSVISEKIRDNLTFNTFLQLEQITDEVDDFVVHLLTCLYSYAQLLPFDTTELTQRATFFTRHIKFTQRQLYARLKAELHFFSELLETNLISYLSSYVFWLLTFFPEINQTLVSKKILVISDMGINHSQYISYYVQDILDLHKIRSDILPINGEQLGNYDLESFDLIITNQPISETNVPSVVINDALLFSNKKKLLDLLYFKDFF